MPAENPGRASASELGSTRRPRPKRPGARIDGEARLRRRGRLRPRRARVGRSRAPGRLKGPPRLLSPVPVAPCRLPRSAQGRLWSAAAAIQEPPLGAGRAVHVAQLGLGLLTARSVLAASAADAIGRRPEAPAPRGPVPYARSPNPLHAVSPCPALGSLL